MRKIIGTCLVLIPGFLAAQDYVPGQVIVQLQPGTSIESAIGSLGETAEVPVITSYQQVSQYLNAWLLELPDAGVTESALIETYLNSPLILHAQPNYYVHWRQVPNDNSFPMQWNLFNTGQSGGTPGADIKATEAWNITTGGLTALGDTIVIAVVDGGVDKNHEDLVDNLWRNYADPINGIDDDGNGFIDDFWGWNFYNNDGNLPKDYHGTGVASVIGAMGDNGIGITGVNWNVKLMNVAGPKTLTQADVLKAYSYILGFRKAYNATNGLEGAFVVAVNSSWGIDKAKPADFPLWCAMYDSMGVAGILNCAATANANWNVDVEGDMPTGCTSPYLISVTNTDHNDQKVIGAAYGFTSVDLGAPGDGAWVARPDNQYAQYGGTSTATPHVTGAVGLIYSTSCVEFAQFSRENPSTAALTVKQFILNGVDPNPSLQGKTVTGGRLNLYNSMVGVENYGACFYTEVEASQPRGIVGVTPNPARNVVTVTYNETGSEPTTIIITNIIGQQVRLVTAKEAGTGLRTVTIDISTLPAGVYLVFLQRGLHQSQHHKMVVY